METSFEKLVTALRAKKESGVKRAVLIGINYFGQDNQLSGCVNDVFDMQSYLTDIGFTEITMLKDSKVDPEHTFSNCPTGTNILDALRRAVEDSNPGDTLYVHYSGHGSHIDDKSDSLNPGDEKDGQDECICPVDFDYSKENNGFIIDDLLNEVLVKNLKPGVKLRVCFDSCHSGSALDLPYQWVSSDKFEIENDSAEKGKDVIFISGCQDDQTSSDSKFNGRAAGAMTWSLLNALWDIKKSGKFSKKWTWEELIHMMRISLKKERYDQIPQISFENQQQLKNFVDLI